MDTRYVVKRYYELVDQGDWGAWTDLFVDHQVMDGQLAGRVEGREALHQMTGFSDGIPSFWNIPRHLTTDGEQAAAVSHIPATTPAGDSRSAH